MHANPHSFQKVSTTLVKENIVPFPCVFIKQVSNSTLCKVSSNVVLVIDKIMKNKEHIMHVVYLK